MKKIISCVLLASLLAGSAASFSCGEPKQGGLTVDSSSAGDSSEDSSTDEKPEEYPYYGADLGGKTLRIYNVKKDLWNMICVLNPDELNGEKVNDAIFNRNAKVEKLLNCQIEEINEENSGDMVGRLQKAVSSDDGEFDAAYMKMDVIGAGITQGYYHDLDQISTLHLDESWWDSVLIDATSIGGKNYFATSSAHLMGWDSLWCLFFNETMMENLNLETPYQLVRDGKWTLDKFQEYCAAAANLNGDDSFKLKNDGSGSCVWGSVSFGDVITKFIFGLNVDFATKDKDDMPTFGCNENFVNACQKLAEVIGQTGIYADASATETDKHYYQTVFENQRALFLGAETKTAQLLRGAEWNFGILPYPKLDETQENYRSTAVHQIASFTIPVCSRNAEDVGLLFDALSYESDKAILDEYFTNVVEQKGLRNEDSIDMLHIIKATRSFDIGIAYGWFSDLTSAVATKIKAGKTDIASVIDKNKDKVQTKIGNTIEAMQ